MNLDELKTEWAEYGRQIEISRRIEEGVITSMIATRSSLRFSGVRKKYLVGMAWIAICLLAGTFVLVTNPFDYEYRGQYLPLSIYCVCLVAILGGMINGYARLGKLAFEKETLELSLRSIVAEYERPRAMMKYALYLLLFTAVVLFPLSFLPQNIKTMGWQVALAERLVPMAISTFLLFMAYKLGAFKEKNATAFRKDLNEFEQLRAMLKELKAQ